MYWVLKCTLLLTCVVRVLVIYTLKHRWCSIDVPRLKPASDRVSHVRLSSGFTCAWIAQPSGAIGFRMKSWGPWTCAYADMLGVIRDCRRRFKVSSAGSRSWHQSDSGNLSSTPARIEIKCALNVCMARSAWLRRWLPGGTSSYVIPFAVMHSLKASDSDASLSSLCSRRPSPALLILSIICWYARIILPTVLFFIGSTKIYLASR